MKGLDIEDTKWNNMDSPFLHSQGLFGYVLSERGWMRSKRESKDKTMKKGSRVLVLGPFPALWCWRTHYDLEILKRTFFIKKYCFLLTIAHMTRWCSIACVLEKGSTENERRSALIVYVSINHLGHFTGPGSAHSLQTRLKSTGAHSYKGICTLLSPKESQIWCIWAIKSVSLQNCHFLSYKSLGLSFPGRKIKGCLNLWAPWALPSASLRLAKSSEFLNISVLRCTVTLLHFLTEPVRMSTSLSTLVLSWLKNSSQGWEEEVKKKKKKERFKSNYLGRLHPLSEQ